MFWFHNLKWAINYKWFMSKMVNLTLLMIYNLLKEHKILQCMVWKTTLISSNKINHKNMKQKDSQWSSMKMMRMKLSVGGSHILIYVHVILVVRLHWNKLICSKFIQEFIWDHTNQLLKPKIWLTKEYLIFWMSHVKNIQREINILNT